MSNTKTDSKTSIRSFVGRTQRRIELPPERLVTIPPEYRPAGGAVERVVVADHNVGPLRREAPERVAQLFRCAVADVALP